MGKRQALVVGSLVAEVDLKSTSVEGRGLKNPFDTGANSESPFSRFWFPRVPFAETEGLKSTWWMKIDNRPTILLGRQRMLDAPLCRMSCIKLPWSDSPLRQMIQNYLVGIGIFHVRHNTCFRPHLANRVEGNFSPRRVLTFYSVYWGKNKFTLGNGSTM